MALNFGGTSQYVEIPDSISLRLSGQCFMSSWVYINSFPASNKYSSIIVKKYDGSKIGYFLDIYNSSGTLKLRVGSYQNANYATVWDITGWNTGEWHWIAGGYDGSNWNVYFDGERKNQSVNATGAISTSLPVNLGCTNLNSTYARYLNGRLFDSRIYNQYPSANEIAEIYHKRGADRVWQGLVGWWRLDEKTSGILTPNPYDTVVPTMTSNTTPSGVASASSEYSSDYEAWRAFSFSATSWASTVADMPDVWLKYDFGSGVTKTVKCYIIQPHYKTPAANPKDWTFEGSNNDSGWTVLDTQTNVTDWPTSGFLTFPISNSTAYRYYRLNTSANNGHAITHVMNLQLLEYSPANSIIDLSGNGNHGTPHGGTYQASPHRLRRGVLVS